MSDERKSKKKEQSVDEKIVGVTSSVIEKFLGELSEKQVDTETIQRIRKTILSDGKTSETALRAALFNED